MKTLKATIYLTTALVVIYTLLTQLNVPFPFIFLLFLTSQGALIFMVYRVLTDNYQTQRTFEDWYGDKDVRQKSRTA